MSRRTTLGGAMPTLPGDTDTRSASVLRSGERTHSLLLRFRQSNSTKSSHFNPPNPPATPHSFPKSEDFYPRKKLPDSLKYTHRTHSRVRLQQQRQQPPGLALSEGGASPLGYRLPWACGTSLQRACFGWHWLRQCAPQVELYWKAHSRSLHQECPRNCFYHRSVRRNRDQHGPWQMPFDC